MAADKELRFTITADIENALMATARAFNLDKGAVARDVLAEWAAKKLHEATIHVGLDRANGERAESARRASGTDTGITPR